MKRSALVGVMVTEHIRDILRKLAEEDERTISWTAEKLIREALEYRGLIAQRSSGKGAKKTKRKE